MKVALVKSGGFVLEWVDLLADGRGLMRTVHASELMPEERRRRRRDVEMQREY